MKSEVSQTYSYNDLSADEKSFVLIPRKELIETAAKAGKSWEEVSELYRLQKLARMDIWAYADFYAKAGEVNEVGTSIGVNKSLMVEAASISDPLTDALHEERDDLVDCILENYPVALDHSLHLISTAAHSKNGLKKIEDYCLAHGLTDYFKEQGSDLIFAYKELCNFEPLKPGTKEFENALKLVELGADVEKTDENESFLAIAARKGQAHLCESLIKAGHSVLDFADKYATVTNYEVAYERFIRHPENKSYQETLKVMRENVSESDKHHLEALEKKVVKSEQDKKHINRILTVGSVMVLSVFALLVSRCQTVFAQVFPKQKTEERGQQVSAQKTSQSAKTQVALQQHVR